MHTPGPAQDVRFSDSAYLKLIEDALGKCRAYRPKFGRGGRVGLTVEQFQDLYRRDEFYSWFGLDSPLVYAAHRAAGGITSVYRQIGIACQWLFQRVLQDALGLSPPDSLWSYSVPSTREKERKLSLDGRIPLTGITVDSRLPIVHEWLRAAADCVKLAPGVFERLNGAVFEARQGYKSADSKRQNADILNAANAYAHSYLPVVLLFSSQIDVAIAERYVRAQWLLLRGTTTGSATESTYVFCREVLGYDLAGFFVRQSARIRAELQSIIEGLLK